MDNGRSLENQKKKKLLNSFVFKFPYMVSKILRKVRSQELDLREWTKEFMCCSMLLYIILLACTPHQTDFTSSNDPLSVSMYFLEVKKKKKMFEIFTSFFFKIIFFKLF